MTTIRRLASTALLSFAGLASAQTATPAPVLADCDKTLQPMMEDAARTDEAIKQDYPPADAEMYLPVVRASRTNLKLCKG